MSGLSVYETHALKEIHNWKNPEIGWFGQAMKITNQPMDKAGDLLLDTPEIGFAIRKSIEGLTSICNDAAQWSVRPEAIFEEFRPSGHSNIKNHKDLADLDLRRH